MYRPKKGFENTTINYRLGMIAVQVRVEDINQNHIDAAKRYNIDLTYYLEKDGFDEKQHKDLIELQKDESKYNAIHDKYSPEPKKKPSKKKK